MPKVNEVPIVVARLSVRGKLYEVTCNDRGRFNVWPRLENVYERESLEDLRVALMVATKKAAVKLALHCTIIENDVPTPCVITGRHQKTRELILKYDNGRRTTVKYGRFLAPLTAPERDEYKRLVYDVAGAKAALATFEKTHALNVEHVVMAAERAAEQEGKAEATLPPAEVPTVDIDDAADVELATQ